MNRPRLSLLAMTAHPDDETGSFGGTLALCAAGQVTTEVVCATRGEAARNRGSARTGEELAEMRSRELDQACELLGVSWHEIWDYPDGGLNRVGLLDLGRRLCGVIRQRRPTVVLTLGPEGGFTGHLDHVAISHFATFAFHAAGRQDFFPETGQPYQAQRLYYATGLNPLAGYPQVCFSPVTVEVDIAKTFQRKLEAFQCHHTQAPLFPRFRAALERVGPTEWFHLAAASAALPPGMNHDLFAGL